ncbi:DUF4381 family protein [Luteimonas vadosa]|uniref:DUF4381 domain-containing protein n=1 Tax=Luteimonas vadosa TaxID=1165507 RepID=A0ABP9DTW9_9GAMM
MQGDALVLRDIHPAAAPPWWPPAPGWWVVAGIAAVVLALVLARWWRLRRRRRRIEALFDDAMAAAGTPALQVAAMSELLRRASRRRDPHADALQGQDWLDFLDAGEAAPLFDGPQGRVLLEGGFRRDADADAVASLRRSARTRFIQWMTARG